MWRCSVELITQYGARHARQTAGLVWVRYGVFAKQTRLTLRGRWSRSNDPVGETCSRLRRERE